MCAGVVYIELGDFSLYRFAKLIDVNSFRVFDDSLIWLAGVKVEKEVVLRASALLLCSLRSFFQDFIQRAFQYPLWFHFTPFCLDKSSSFFFKLRNIFCRNNLINFLNTRVLKKQYFPGIWSPCWTAGKLITFFRINLDQSVKFYFNYSVWLPCQRILHDFKLDVESILAKENWSHYWGIIPYFWRKITKINASRCTKSPWKFTHSVIFWRYSLRSITQWDSMQQKL